MLAQCHAVPRAGVTDLITTAGRRPAAAAAVMRRPMVMLNNRPKRSLLQVTAAYITWGQFVIKKTADDPGSEVEVKGTLWVNGDPYNFGELDLPEETTFNPARIVAANGNPVYTEGLPRLAAYAVETDSTSGDDVFYNGGIAGDAVVADNNWHDVDVSIEGFQSAIRYRCMRV